MTGKDRFFLASTLLAMAVSLPAAADQVILDDLIILGSQCVGLGCEADVDFQFDTLRLRSDNPLIRFQDTSSSAQFPTRDWTMGAAENAANVSVFSVKDANSDISVLQLTATEDGGVALGAGAELVQNAVSVGTAGSERRITHVADAVDPTDAVNLGQLQLFEAGIDPQLTALEDAMLDIIARVDALNARLDNL